ncbi:MAG: tetratricopeptide repeat protein [Flavobacteriaceae bacterium]|nr:tetratricopeptide repeat protein [Flavobacteriaceae bacterium]
MNRIFILIIYFAFATINYAQTNDAIKVIDKIKSSSISVDKKISLLETNISSEKDTLTIMLNAAALGDLYSIIEAYDKSYEYYIKALQIAQSKKLKIHIGDYYQGLGKIQLRTGNLQSSLEFHTKAYEVFKKTRKHKRKNLALGNIAVIQSKIGPLEKAINTLKNLSTDKGFDNRSKANALMTLGNIYLEKLDIPEKAIDYYNQALNLLNKKSSKTIQIMLLQNIAEAQIELNNYDKALISNKKSEIILKQASNLELLSSLHKFYSNIYKEKKQYKKAYTHLTLQQKYNDSIANSTTLLKIANINAANELEKHKTDTTLQENKITNLEREKTINNLKTTVLLISLVLLGLVTYLLIKKSHYRIKTLSDEKTEIIDKLDFNKNKIEKMALNIATSQEYVTSFSEKIKDTLIRITDKKSKEEITKLLTDLQSYKMISNNKKELKNYLGKINDEYLFNLTKNYPNLTKEEQHLCSLIYLNLKNKDISNLLNLSIRSIENKRYRIRKKMNLETTQSLSNTLNDL